MIGTYLDNYFNYNIKTIEITGKIIEKELKNMIKKLKLIAKKMN